MAPWPARVWKASTSREATSPRDRRSIFWHAVAEVNDCRIVGNYGGGFGGAVYARYADTDVVFNGCWFEDNYAAMDGGAIYGYGAGSLTLSGCTFVGSDCGQYGSAITIQDATVDMERCLLTDGLGNGGSVFPYSGGTFVFSCSDIYANGGGDWVSGILDQYGTSGNISEDPLYCDPASANYALRSSSPCATDNSPCGLHVGAWDVGCSDTATARASWSQVKSLY